MRAYEQLDAFQVCHELTIQAHGMLKGFEERDPELATQLWSAVLVATSRIARGAGMGNRRMFAACLDRTLGALAEVDYHLKMARVLDLVTEEAGQALESLRGRAVFYATKLLVSLMDGTEGAG
ncbi:MAG TPA: four helix bundle protein [Gemmatimonadales bacterium]